WRQRYVRQINIILVVMFAIYAYRDLVPLTTYTHLPQGIGEGRLLWAKVAVLTITGLSMLRTLPPFEHLTKTTPLISSYSSSARPVISAAYRLAHFPYEQLPPLADYGAAKHLKQKSFEVQCLVL
ncbi:hypothetical protein BDZ89DRAFT_936864, partial [Hymenopellis radicata]